jgi:Flp pilus assembly protein TadG
MPSNIRSLTTFITDERGSYTVEFVILVPLLLAALVFSFEFARALWAYDVMTRDVRAGVRYLSRSTSLPDATCSSAQTLVMNGTDASAHFPWNGTPPTFACSTTAFSIANFSQDGSVITMTATVPVTLSFLDFLNQVDKLTGGAKIATSYTLSVSDQTRFIGF